MTISRRVRIAALAGALATFAFPLAPVAQATSNPVTCQDGGATRVCQKQGHTSLHTSPPARSSSGSLFGSPWLPGYGKGHLPPIIALD